jgi:hypothetical protein
VLDDVAIGPFAENPARKDPAPSVVALILHRQLDERAGFGRILPRRGLLARAQAYNGASDARRFAGLHFELADQPVAFVEQADDGDALGHRGRTLNAADLLRNAFGLGHRRNGRAAIALGRRPVASAQRGRGQQREQRSRGPTRHYSPGRQAS